MHHRSLTMRLAIPSDAAAIARLVELEGAQPLSGEHLVAELDGTIIAALSLDDGRAVADIFRPTAGITRTLRHWRSELVDQRHAPHVRSVQRSRRLMSLRRAPAWT